MRHDVQLSPTDMACLSTLPLLTRLALTAIGLALVVVVLAGSAAASSVTPVRVASASDVMPAMVVLPVPDVEPMR
jgi:hypothetical protein